LIRRFAHSPHRPFAASPIRRIAHSPHRPFAASPIRRIAHSSFFGGYRNFALSVRKIGKRKIKI
jgi:hypothetical protein